MNRRKNLITRRLITWFQNHGRHDLPWRQSPTPYDVLVSEFMLQQTTVATITPRFYTWMQRFPDIKALAKAEEHEVLSAWQGLGYYARARRLHAAAKAIVAQHQGIIPANLTTLMELPGIGRYTASALMAFAFDQPVEVLDTNIIRVVARLNNITTAIDTASGRRHLEEVALTMLPKKEGRSFASALMDLGSMICIATTPKCDICPLSELCQAENPSSLPQKKPRAVVTKKKEQRAFYQRDNTLYLEQSTGPLWKGLWILPSYTRPPKQKEFITSIIYPITRYRITMQLYRPAGLVPKNLKPFSLDELEHLAIPSPHRKAIKLGYQRHHNRQKE
ncbi:MAG TPA: A/G-specific adenine glycosylase [Chthoniobacterales bacterium]|nr:A/G-specific adenine glycosylase [Chthoniobacterales bacterium]